MASTPVRGRKVGVRRELPLRRGGGSRMEGDKVRGPGKSACASETAQCCPRACSPLLLPPSSLPQSRPTLLNPPALSMHVTASAPCFRLACRSPVPSPPATRQAV